MIQCLRFTQLYNILVICVVWTHKDNVTDKADIYGREDEIYLVAYFQIFPL